MTSKTPSLRVGTRIAAALLLSALGALSACADDDPVDICAAGACSGKGACSVTDDGASCACDAGYAASGLECVDIDECASGDDDCDENATCANSDGTYACTCDAGLSGDGTRCVAAGVACDPEAETNDCVYDCFPVEAGGVCADPCDADAECLAGWRCDPEYADEGATGVCLPNAACGALTVFGECEGTALTYCDTDGPVTFDCATETDAAGAPLACAVISDDIGVDCAPASYTGGCGKVSEAGSCDGTVLSFCVAQASGKIETQDCADKGLVCSDTSGFADCIADGATGCGSVSAGGTCDSGVATWCADDEVATDDCASTGKVCGYEGANFRCVDAVVAGNAHSVTGTFVFEKKAFSEGGLGAISNLPVRHARVTVRDAADETVLAEGYTDAAGAYALQFEGDGDVYVLVTAQGEPGKHNHMLRDCPMDDCGDGPGNLYGVETDEFTPEAATELGEALVTVASGNAGAFNIFDVFVKGADFAQANMGKYPPAVTVEWRSGQGTAGGTSYFSGYNSKIYVLGGDEDTDEYDDLVLLHEYGHYLEFYLSRSDSPGGDHDGSKTDPRLAWGEGYGTYVGCAIADTPNYIDTTAAGASLTDVRVAGNDYLGELSSPKAMKQLTSEFLIAQILWTIAKGPEGTDGKGHGPTFDVLANYFTGFKSPSDGRGLEGVELVDYLDGWFCKQHGDKPYIQSIIEGMAQFPYDYAGPATCN